MSAPRPFGSFCWFELATSDVRAADAFYRAVFAWQALGDPGAPGAFVKWAVDGREFGAVYAVEGERPGGVCRHWLPYVKVRDAERMAVRVAELGGRVRFGPADAGPFGRMLFLEDPGGAHLGLWQPKEHEGAPSDLPELRGTPCWSELATRDPDAATAFLVSLFDWSAEDSGDEEQAYTIFQAGGAPVAGMIVMDERWGGAPPHWLPYFGVDDCVAAAGRIAGAGGTVCVGPKPVPGVGLLAVGSDPGGATFAILQPEARR